MRMENTTHIHAPVDRGILPANPPIVDRFGRTFNYLRIALNEQCNLRCIYCMPEEGIDFRSEDKLLTTKEIFRIIQITAEMGVSKMRFTGGEPLLRKISLNSYNMPIKRRVWSQPILPPMVYCLGNIYLSLKMQG